MGFTLSQGMVVIAQTRITERSCPHVKTHLPDPKTATTANKGIPMQTKNIGLILAVTIFLSACVSYGKPPLSAAQAWHPTASAKIGKLELVWIPRGMFGLNGEMNDGNITIQATGAGKDSNLTIQGSSVQAAGTTTLKADNQVNLLAAQNTTSESSTNQSKSGSVGVAIQLGAGGGGMGFTASASKATGQGGGNGVTYTNTQVAGNTVNIDSGGDTTLKGAVVKDERVSLGE